MTHPQRAVPVFRPSAPQPTPVQVALVSLTVYRATVYTEARCPPPCNRKVMDIPGVVVIQTRAIKSEDERSGRGRVVPCKKCGGLVEVIEHG